MNSKFSNEKILKETLPKFEEIETSKLNIKYYSVTVISSIIVFFILSIILGLAFNFLDFDWFENYSNTIIVLYLSIWVLLFFYDWISFNRKSYAFRDHDVIYKYGVLWQTTVLIPFKTIKFFFDSSINLFISFARSLNCGFRKSLPRLFSSSYSG